MLICFAHFFLNDCSIAMDVMVVCDVFNTILMFSVILKFYAAHSHSVVFYIKFQTDWTTESGCC